MTITHPELRRALRAYLTVAVLIPLLLTLGGVSLMLIWMPQMPETIAVHWSLVGVPDGFGPAWSTPLTLAIVGLFLTALFGLIGAFAARQQSWGKVNRFVGSLAIAEAALQVVGITWSFGIQGGTEGADARIGVVMLVSLGIGVLVGVAAWFLQPTVSMRRSDAAQGQATPLPMRAEEHAVWFSHTAMRGALAFFLYAVQAIMLILAIAMAITRTDGWIIAVVVTAVLIVAVLTSTRFAVRVSESGMRVRSALGLPRVIIPAATISAVRVVHVDAFAQFGGWGLRWGDGRFGVIMSSGPAIEVTRDHKRTFVVTNDDAETGAALLSAYAEKARKEGHDDESSAR